MRRILGAVTLVLLCAGADAQMLRYNQHRELEPPEYATLKLGPFFSDLSFRQTAGFRYTTSEGTGTDFLFGNNRGVIKADGWEYPLVSTIDTRNYLLISRHMDLDISFSLGYALYPMDTQENEFFVDIAEEGISGSISMEFLITRYIRGRVSDDILYRTDYIDLRGVQDYFGGSAYEHFKNTLGFNADWLMDAGKNLGLDISRTDLMVMSDEFKDQERVTLSEGTYYEQQLAQFLVGGVQAKFDQTAYQSAARADTSMQTYTAYSRIKLTENTDGGLSAGISTGSSDDLQGGSTDSFNMGADLNTQLTREWKQGVSLKRGLNGGFSAPFDIYSTLAYNLSYSYERTSFNFGTSFSSVEPQTETLNAYDDLTASLNVELPLTRFIGLLFSTQYTSRKNSSVPSPDVTEPEYISDYESLSFRAGTSFALTRKIDFDIYAQHIERGSNNPDLQYTRDILAGTFTFSHAF